MVTKKERAKFVFHKVVNAGVRAASAAAFRAKLWGKTLREINGIPLHQLTNEPLRREIHRQNAFAVAVYGRHLPVEQRRKLLEQIDRRTKITSNMEKHLVLKAGKFLAAGALAFYIGRHTNNEFVHWLSVVSSGGLPVLGVKQLLMARKGEAIAYHNTITNRNTISPDTGSFASIHEAAHSMLPRRKAYRKNEQEIKANTVLGLYTRLRSRTDEDVHSPETWPELKDPYLKGEALGKALGNLIARQETRKPAWTLLHLMSSGKITPQEAYERAYKITPARLKVWEDERPFY
ncbi:MAG: hypothetical protein V1722_04370 [Candidatus Micrarchaeota archaeon]